MLLIKNFIYWTMEVGIASILLGLILALVAIVTIALIFRISSTNSSLFQIDSDGKNSGKTTYFLDEGEDEKKCEICYGRIGEENIATCTCGRTFHDACAKPTGTCPYCGCGYDAMDVRKPLRARCPICGRFVSGSICECGAVLPRKDNTFLCSCGNRVDVGKPVCKKCGAAYESMTAKPVKRK